MKDHEELFKKAFDAGKKRNYRKSFTLFQQLVSLTDEYPNSFLYMGRCCHALGEKERAVRFYRYFLRRFPGSPAGLFFLGRTYLSLGAWNRGLSILDRVYRLKPDHPHLKSFLGFGFLRCRRIDSAVKFLGLAVEEDPKNEKLYQAYLNALYLQGIRAFYREDRDFAGEVFSFLFSKNVETTLLFLHMAIIEKEAENYDESLRWYDRALQDHPEDQLIRIQRAELLYLAGKKDAALSEWEKIPVLKEINTDSVNPLNLRRIAAVEHYQSGKYRKAFYFATNVLKSEKDPNMHLIAGESARNLGNYNIAVNHFRRVLDAAPEMIEPRYGLIMVYWLESKWRDALTELDRLRKIVPDDSICRYYRTLCFSRLDVDTEETLDMIINEIHLSGPDPWLLTALGDQYSKMNMPELAEKWFQKALKLKDDHKDAYLGLIAVQALRKDLKPLIRSYRNYLLKWGDDVDKRRDFVNLLFAEKQYRKAVTEIEKLLPFSSGERGINRMLAFCYRECERYQDAALIYRQLLKSEPENQVFLRSLVYSLEKSGDRTNAIMILEKAFAFLTPDPGLYLILGVLLYRENRLDNALAVFKKSMELDRNDWRSLYNIGVIYRDKGLKDYAETYFARSERLKAK